MGVTFASFHAEGKYDEVSKRLKKMESGKESSFVPSRNNRGLIRSGPEAFDGSMREIASQMSSGEI